MADMVLDHISEDLHTWAVNLSHEKFERDQISAFTYAREKGLKKGLKEGRKQGMKKGLKRGREQGIAEGSHAAKLETARRMISQNYDINTIANLTTLSLEEIQNIK